MFFSIKTLELAVDVSKHESVSDVIQFLRDAVDFSKTRLLLTLQWSELAWIDFIEKSSDIIHRLRDLHLLVESISVPRTNSLELDIQADVFWNVSLMDILWALELDDFFNHAMIEVSRKSNISALKRLCDNNKILTFDQFLERVDLDTYRWMKWVSHDRWLSFFKTHVASYLDKKIAVPNAGYVIIRDYGLAA